MKGLFRRKQNPEQPATNPSYFPVQNSTFRCLTEECDPVSSLQSVGTFRAMIAEYRVQGILHREVASAFLILMYSVFGEGSAAVNNDGESLFRRPAAQAAAGARAWRRKPARTGAAVRSQCSVCLEDFQPASAQRADGTGGAAARAAQPDGPGGASQVARPAAATAGLDLGRVARATGAERPSEGQHPASLAGAAKDGATA